MRFLFFIESKRWNFDLTDPIPNSDKENWNDSEIIKNAKINKTIFEKRIDSLDDVQHDHEVYSEFSKFYEHTALRSGSKRLRILSSEILFKKPAKEAVSTHTTTGWVVDDCETAIEIRDPYVPIGKRQDGFSYGPSIKEQVKTIAEVVEMIAKKKWSVVRIVSGPRMLQFLFWKECLKSGINAFGYALDKEETKKHFEIVEAAING